jgi:hypothetical protein
MWPGCRTNIGTRRKSMHTGRATGTIRIRIQQGIQLNIQDINYKAAHKRTQRQQTLVAAGSGPSLIANARCALAVTVTALVARRCAVRHRARHSCPSILAQTLTNAIQNQAY